MKARIAASDGTSVVESSDVVVYSLRSDGGAGRDFELNSISGELLTTRPLDHESFQYFTLQTCVYLHDSPSLYQCVNVSVDVIDLNDNRPTVLHQVPQAKYTPIGNCTWQ